MRQIICLSKGIEFGGVTRGIIEFRGVTQAVV